MLPQYLIEDDEDTQKGEKHNDYCDGGCVNSGGDSKQIEIITTWEIVGDIKSKPEDFVVREIGYTPYPPSVSTTHLKNNDGMNINIISNTNHRQQRKQGWRLSIAGLDDGDHSKECNVKNGDVDDLVPISSAKKAKIEEDIISPLPLIAPVVAKQATNPPPKGKDDKEDMQPMEGLRRILVHCHSINQNKEAHGKGEHSSSSSQSSKENILAQLTDLQRSALDELNQSFNSQDFAADTVSLTNIHGDAIDTVKVKTGSDKNNVVWINTSQLFKRSLNNDIDSGKEDWKLLHRYIRQAFPLLRTETSSTCPICKQSGDVDVNDTIPQRNTDVINKAWVSCLIDTTFFPLAPYLARPCEDLLALYKFRNLGPMPSQCKKGKKRDNKRGRGLSSQLFEQVNNNTGNDTCQGIVMLRLQPDLPRSERRNIHNVLSSSRRREFETSTINDVKLDEDSDTTTAAIVVKWSRNCLSHKKRKRTKDGAADDTNEKNSHISAIFCVLRKYQCEVCDHLYLLGSSDLLPALFTSSFLFFFSAPSCSNKCSSCIKVPLGRHWACRHQGCKWQ